MKKVRILSIDGGGIRGIIPAVILSSLDSKIKKRLDNPDLGLIDFIDFVAGTSTGGIIAAGLLLPGRGRSPYPPQGHYSPQDLVDFYFKYGPSIFRRSIWDKIKSVGGLVNEKYSSEPLKKALQDQFVNYRLSDLIRPCIITAYDITARRSCFFGQHKSHKSQDHDYYVKDVALATASAPSYFEPVKIRSLANIEYPLIDGGVFANNPAMCAYAEARKLSFPSHNLTNPTAKDMMILSIGTGAVDEPYAYSSAKKWGALGWVRPVISIMMSGNSETVSHQLRWMFDAAENPNGFIRLEPELIKANSAMDDASDKNMKALANDASLFALQNDYLLDSIVDRLLEGIYVSTGPTMWQIDEL